MSAHSGWNLNQSSAAHQERMYHIMKSEEFGYGFTFYTEPSVRYTGKYDHVIEDVEEGLPMARAGVQEGDVIIAVNGLNVSNAYHKQVLTLMQSSHFLNLLVIDREGYDCYSERRMSLDHLQGSTPICLKVSTDDSSVKGRVSAQEYMEKKTLLKDMSCQICFENERTHCFFPCCHYMTCQECTDHLLLQAACSNTAFVCPFCNQKILKVEKLFL